MKEAVTIKAEQDATTTSSKHGLDDKIPLDIQTVPRGLQQELRRVCNLKPAATGFVKIAIIPHNKTADSCIENKSIEQFTLTSHSTFANLVTEYRQRYPECEMITLVTATYGRPLAPMGKITLTKNQDLLMLRAKESSVSMESLWLTHALKMSILQANEKWKAGPDLNRLHVSIVAQWSKMSLAGAQLLHVEAARVSEVTSDETEARAFWIFYDKMLASSMASKPLQTNRRSEKFLTHVLQKWLKHSRKDMQSWLLESRKHANRFPLPRLPSLDKKKKQIVGVDEMRELDLEKDAAIPGAEDLTKVTLEHLEQVYEAGQELCSNLQTALESAPSVQAHWLERINDLVAMSALENIKIGIMGATGVGKSTIINALLGDRDLLPTSSIQACTAVPIQIKYNKSPEAPYQVKVKFVDRTAWEQDIRICMSYIQTLDPSDDVEEAQIAREKISLVYPGIEDDEIEVDFLMSISEVTDTLGTEKSTCVNSAEDLERLLRTFSGTQEDLSIGSLAKSASRCTWPLVESIEIFIRSEFLQDGLVLVDLPGVQDTNKARAAVALSDQAAQELIKDRLTQQLLCKGVLESITLLCSRSDDLEINGREADRLGVAPEFKKLEESQTRLKKDYEALVDRLTGAKCEVRDCESMYQEKRVQLCEAKNNLTNVRAGQTVYGSYAGDSSLVRARKRLRTRSADLDTVATPTNNTDANEKALTEQAAAAEITRLDEQLTSFEARLTSLENTIEELENQKLEINKQLTSIKPHQTQILMDARNTKVRAGVKARITAEMQEVVCGKDKIAAQGLNADDLPNNFVFCVSAKAFLNIGDGDRLKPEVTEIPKVREHCQRLAEDMKTQQLTKHLNLLASRINTLRLWAESSDSDSVSSLTTEERLEKSLKLREELMKADQAVGKVVRAFCDAIGDLWKGKLSHALREGSRNARDKAVSIAEGWGGSHSVAVYRRTVRGMGKDPKREHQKIDFNLDLCQPILEAFGRAWTEATSHEIKEHVVNADKTFSAILSQLHNIAMKYAKEVDPGSMAFRILQDQTKKCLVMFKDALDDLMSELAEISWNLPDEMRDEIELKLKFAYEHALTMKGRGSGLKMRCTIVEAVRNNKDKMLKTTTLHVRTRIESRLESAAKKLSNATGRILKDLITDYQSAIDGPSTEVSEEDRNLQREVSHLIHTFRETCCANHCPSLIKTDQNEAEDADDSDEDEESGLPSGIEIKAENIEDMF